jgi:diaminopimelate decarboxylase
MIEEGNIIDFIRRNLGEDVDPYYIYDIQTIRKKCTDFNSIPYQNKSIHFATMANINAEFLAIVKEGNLNVFVNSLKHLESVKEAGFTGSEIVFTSSALSAKVMNRVYEEKVQVNLDSVRQLELWQSLFPHQAVGIRCNIGGLVKSHSTRAGFF